MTEGSTLTFSRNRVGYNRDWCCIRPKARIDQSLEFAPVQITEIYQVKNAAIRQEKPCPCVLCRLLDWHHTLGDVM